MQFSIVEYDLVLLRMNCLQLTQAEARVLVFAQDLPKWITNG